MDNKEFIIELIKVFKNKKASYSIAVLLIGFGVANIFMPLWQSIVNYFFSYTGHEVVFSNEPISGYIIFFSGCVFGLLNWWSDYKSITINTIHNQKSNRPIKAQVPVLFKLKGSDKALINNLFTGKFHLVDITHEEPKLIFVGAAELDENIKSISSVIRKNLENNPKSVNDAHAILSERTNIADIPLTIYYETLDYADVLALRKSNLKPKVISADVLPICIETKEVILHRRSPDSATYPDALHIFGGGFWPEQTSFGRNDGYSLINTMKREFSEELKGASIMINKGTHFLIGFESDTGFFQFSALGVNIDILEMERMSPNWEGSLVRIHFDDLLEKLIDGNEVWAPSGKAHILTWLALGAPGVCGDLNFSGLSAIQLFEQVMSNAST